MMNSTWRTRHQAAKLFRDYLNDENYTEINTPILTSNDCEGAGETFLVRPANQELLKNMVKQNVSLENAYFDHATFLTVSGQLHLEAMSHGLGNTYTFGPTFRAENCKSPIHLSEFYMLEIEKVFVDSLDDLIEVTESIVKSVTRKLLDNCQEDILKVRNQKSLEDFDWLEKKFPIVKYEEAIRILAKNQSELKSKVDFQEGISKEQELFLVKHFKCPVFVIDWPISIKSFYMREKKSEPGIVEALDLLVPHVGELVGGSVREDDYDRLKDKLPNLESLNWYLDLRKYGSVTTAGFGLGFERYLQWILNIHNIKDVIPFPRWAHNCSL
jgi:asparaginyl-tRNA synthetase